MIAGRIGRPHGLDGSFHVTDPRPHLLTLGAELEGLGRIIARKGPEGQPILRIDAASDRTAASSTPRPPLPASPRQPACAAATARPSRSHSSTGRQSATMIVQAHAFAVDTQASASAPKAFRMSLMTGSGRYAASNSYRG